MSSSSTSILAVSLWMGIAFGQTTTVSLDQPAYVGMPVWLKVENANIRYPYFMGTAGFGCHVVEVRREGEPLEPMAGSSWRSAGMPGNICAGYIGSTDSTFRDRLPLHLLYRFDVPGTYEVRYARRTQPLGWSRPGEIRLSSEWTPIEVLPSTAPQREAWRNALLQRAQAADGPEILTDVLPNMLAFPDQFPLDNVLGYLYYAHGSVRLYAMRGLAYWPQELVQDRIRALLHSQGPSDAVAEFLTRTPRFWPGLRTEILDASLPYLASNSAVLIGGAIAAASRGPASDPAFQDAILRSAENVMARADARERDSFASVLAAIQNARSGR